MSLLVTYPLNQKKNINVYKGTHGKYYTITKKHQERQEERQEQLKEEEVLNETILKYDIHFPTEWADDDGIYCYLDIETKVGPRYCNNCIEYGFYNGVFKGYCANCANLLAFKRGNGILDNGEEVNEKTFAFNLENIKEKNSMWNTYLKDVTKEEIGDTQLLEEYEMYKDLPPLI